MSKRTTLLRLVESLHERGYHIGLSFDASTIEGTTITTVFFFDKTKAYSLYSYVEGIDAIIQTCELIIDWSERREQAA